MSLLLRIFLSFWLGSLLLALSLYLMQRYLLGLGDARSPVTAGGERGWFAAYGLLAPQYRSSP